VSTLPELQAGAVFAADYRIERLLARGGMGAVYVAHQLSTGRKRALKLMHPLLTGDESLRRRFEQEARVGSRIKSSHVVEVIAAGVDAASGMPWLAMELLDGEDLAQYGERLGPRPLGEVVEILSQICHALGAAHDVGVVHRDLKPENVFLARSLQQGSPTLVKLLDLGIAKIVAEASPRQTAAVGTPLWMAPEQMGGSVGPQADVWALGLLAFWLLTGRHYWRSAASLSEGSLLAVLREVASEPLEPASLRASALGANMLLPAGFDAWFAKAVAREPSARFANANVAQQGFAALATGVAHTLLVPTPSHFAVAGAQSDLAFGEAMTAPGAVLPTLPAAKRRRGWAAATLVGLVAVAAGVGLLRSRSAAQGMAAASSTRPAPIASASVGVVAPLPAPAPPLRQAADLSDSSLVWKVPLGDSPALGAADAPVTIVEFANFQCPFSKTVEPALRQLLSELPGKVRLVWKDDPLAVHTQAELAATVAREARAEKGESGFWAAHDLLLTRDFKPNDVTLRAAAKKLALDPAKVERAIATRSYADVISTDADLADDLMTLGTPSFFVNGRRVTATVSLDRVRAAVLDELAKVDALVASGVPREQLQARREEGARGPAPLEIKHYAFASVTAPTRGAANSVTLVEVCDYKNYLCKLVDPLMDELLQKFPQDLGVTWVEPEHYVSDESRSAAIAARAAYRLGGVEGFDRFRRLLFETQGQGFSAPQLTQLSRAAGVDVKAFASALVEPEIFGEIDREMVKARESAVHEVPAFFVCSTDFCASGGYFLSGGQPRRAFEKRVRLVLAAKGGSLPASP
jgi:serine/threonine protein kinase